tara:strand:- start:2329 stop:4806 length:2478 start_codon:yes stop_codon:yes gene_type:complete
MKQLLTSLLLLIGLTCLAQPTYLDLTIQLDQYPPETAWVITQGPDTVVVSPSYMGVVPNTLVEQRVFLNSNTDYTFTIIDAFGDGICCEFGEGFFITANNCEGIVFEEYEFGSSIASYDFNLIPCELPTSDVTFRVNLANAPPEIETPGVLGNWNGWQIIPLVYDEGDEWFVTIPIQSGNYIWKFADFNNPDLQELPVGIGENSCFLFDGNGFVNRTLTVIENEDQILPNYCWESCLPCGAIPGCSDFNAVNWNPWANYDDGSCIIQNSECPQGEALIEIIVTPDNFGQETSWALYGEQESLFSAPIGTYTGAAAGIPISNTYCVPEGAGYDIMIEDIYGDGLAGATTGGNVNGNFVVLGCEGDTLYNLQDEFPEGNFGYQTLSTYFTPIACNGTTALTGCTDSNFVEYNFEATLDDGSCLTSVIWGCLDDSQFNYNPEANTEDVIQFCDYTLTITDGVGDGWFGSWVGVYQQGYFSPQYQMGPNDETEVSFNISGLDASKRTHIYFFTTPQSISTIQQCGFTLTNSEGDIIIESPFFSTIPFIEESGWYVYEIDLYCGNTCEEFVYGCLDETASNFNLNSNTEDGSCYYQPGCTQAGYLEFYTQDFEADFDNGSCQTLVAFGCVDSIACNYDADANLDNEGCLYANVGYDCEGFCLNDLDLDGICDENEILGCTNQNAWNYNLDATDDDEGCLYDAGCISGPGEPYWLNDGCFAWVIDVSPSCCNSGWADGCQELYNYCDENNAITGIIEYGDNEIIVFPNPTNDIVNIASNLQVNAVLYNAIGQSVLEIPNVKQINMSGFESGIYNLILTHNELQFVKKIIKQ